MIALLTTASLSAKAASEMTSATGSTPEAFKAAQVSSLSARLEEINAMDKSSLTKPEKKQLRKEVRSVNKSMRNISGGVYVSVGAIILIVLLLILLL